MDPNPHPKRAPNPFENANIFSKATYWFVYPLLRKGEVGELDIYETLNNWTSTALGNKLESAWKLEQKYENPWIVRPLLKAFGLRMVLLGLIVVVASCIGMVARPLMVGMIVRFFDPAQSELTTQLGLIYCGGLTVLLFVNNLIEQFYTYQVDLLVLRMKIACSTLIYRKLTIITQSVDARGQAVTLITKDLTSADQLLLAIYQLIIGVIMLSVFGYIMYGHIGVSALIALSWLLIYTPIQAIFGKLATWFRLRTAFVTDQRLRAMQETLTAARIIKMYAWEPFFIKVIRKIRKKELSRIRAFYSIVGTAFNLGQLSVNLMLYIAIATYIGFGNTFTAEKIFITMTCIRSLTGVLRIFIPLAMSQLGNFAAATRRLTEFLSIQEVSRETVAKTITQGPPKILVKDLTVIFGNVRVLNDINLQIENGLTMLKGPIGSGKSTLLFSLIGETEKWKGTVDVMGTISYASQEPWLFPGTVRQNILFGERFDGKRYEMVIQVCGLKKDFALFSNGDNTYLTDRGLNLSRGQKTRINLARCVYRNVDIYLLDDCLSSLDPRVAKHIFYECIKGFLKNRICILATHNENYMYEFDHIYVLCDGNVSSVAKGAIVGEKQNKQALTADFNDTENEIHGIEKDDIDPNHISESTMLLNGLEANKNLYEESNDEGSVSGKVYYFYFSSGGGIMVFVIILILLIISQAVASWSDYFIGLWVDDTQKMSNFTLEQQNSTEYIELADSTSNRLHQYSAIVAGGVAIGLLSYIGFVCFSYVASTKIHRLVLSKIFNAALVFFDKNLSGNVLNRFSRDFMILDELLPTNFLHFLMIALYTVAALFVISSVKPILAIPSVLLLVILYFARRFYLRTGRSIRRLEGSTRSPVVGHLNATIDGLSTIRSCVMTPVVTREFERHLDLYNSVIFMDLSTTRAFALLLEMLCILYATVVIFVMMLFRNSLFSGQVGVAITQSLTISGVLLQYGVRLWADVENHMTSTERIMAYSKIDAEKREGQELSDWPNKGKIVYNDVSLRYPLTGDLVLKRISISVNSKEKIGVVGRTGAGKTSLISVLYRLYDYDGDIVIDGINTKHISLKSARSRISIIPQEPFLFTGTLRDNLDPYNEYSDKQIWDALRDVELMSLAYKLYEQVSEGGNNYSIGQKQLICMARAILHKNLILVLDEVTANIDQSTEALIQRSISRNFANCTVITIAHRIHTIINSDRILVLDAGEVVEYDTPEILLTNKRGIFYAMAKDAGLLH